LSHLNKTPFELVLAGIGYNQAADRSVVADLRTGRLDAYRDFRRRRGLAGTGQPDARLIGIDVDIAEYPSLPRT
jgi:hypothetical protein